MIVYLLRSNTTGKCYVGQTHTSISDRMCSHRSNAKRGCPSPISRAIAKYGWADFEIEILEEAIDDADLDMAERAWISIYGSLAPNGYNLESGGAVHKSHHPETRAAIGRAHKGRHFSPEHRKRISDAKRGKPKSAGHARQLAITLQAQSPLDWDKVRAMRAEYARGGIGLKPLGERYGVSYGTAYRVINNLRWKE